MNAAYQQLSEKNPYKQTIQQMQELVWQNKNILWLKAAAHLDEKNMEPIIINNNADHLAGKGSKFCAKNHRFNSPILDNWDFSTCWAYDLNYECRPKPEFLWDTG